MLDPKKLEENGVVITYKEIWDGKPGFDRNSTPDSTRVHVVFLNLTAGDWCRIAMHEGEEYIGGCCGTASAMQDGINGIFRDGGYADADAIYTLGEYAKSHKDGFEGWWKDVSQEQFDTRCNGWEKLTAWGKIELCWHAVKDKVKPHSIEPAVQDNRPDLDDRREIDALYGSMHYLRYSNSGLFRPTDGDQNGQHGANDLLMFAKLYPPAKKLVAKLEANDVPWSGFAIVERARPDVICHNGYGACLYTAEADAVKVMDLWDRDERSEKSAREKPLPEDRTSQKVLLRPVTISVKDGVAWGS